MEKVKGLSKEQNKTTKNKTLIGNSTVITEGKWGGEGKGGINGEGKTHELGWRTHNTIY